MSYNPVTDFLAMLRSTGGGVRTDSLPGLDFVAAALQRMGLINISIGQTAPIANQPTTAWFKPAVPSWSAEGVMYLWNSTTGSYQIATPALWIAMLAPIIGSYQFQNVNAAGPTNIAVGVTLCAVQRNAPAATALVLPNLTNQFATARKLQITDFSTNVVNHTMTLTTPDGATIMAQNTFEILSNDAQLGSVTLTPSLDLNSWIVG